MPVHFYRALLVQDEGDTPESGYGVVFPDLPGCTSWGATRMEAAEQAADALATCIELMMEDKQELPAPSEIGAPLPDWLEGDGVVIGEVLVPVEMPGRAVRANITVDEGLLHRIDMAANAAGNTRSGFLAEAAREWFRNHQRDWAEKRAHELRRDLELLRSGRMRTHEDRGSGQTDTTDASIARIEGWLAELENLPSRPA